jgi:hypothetical protein
MVKREMSSISIGTNCICGAVTVAAVLWRSSERLDVLGEDAEPLALSPALLFESA